MEIRISKAIARHLGEERLRMLGVELASYGWREDAHVDLRNLNETEIEKLRGWLDDMVKLGTRGPKVIIRDIDVWTRALKDASGEKARTLRQFATLLTEYLRGVPGHRIYQKFDSDGDVWLCYYAAHVEFHPAERSNRGGTVPAYVDVDLVYEEFGGRNGNSINFHAEDAVGMTPVEALAEKRYYVEIDEYRARYKAEVARFVAITPQIGRQYLSVGTGTDDLDGNDSAEDRWSSRLGHGSYVMLRDGVPSRVVIDVYKEGEDKDRDRYIDVHPFFWRRNKQTKVVGEMEEEIEYDEKDGLPSAIEIPIHPFCAVFDLRRHLRMRVHVNYLTEYVYDEQMAEKLILPEEVKDIVATLVDHSRATFEDIVRGKAGGVCVLLTGRPGVGKTLTAEVFAESSKRALYSIQASQLGLNPVELEKRLLRALSRGSRWNAVVLIDEADVYVAPRGDDLIQNAIVGVFLRVLEYQSSVLFLTTNRADSVDDAIESRCIARIDYRAPTMAEQHDIWRVLSEINDSSLAATSIGRITTAHPDLTGRDIKQLLKLASVVAAQRKTPVTPEIIDFVARFRPNKPTNGVVK